METGDPAAWTSALGKSVAYATACSALLALANAGLLSCAAASHAASADISVPKVWPLPPAEPRIAYVRSISGPVDFGRSPSGWARLSNLVTGGNRGNEKLVKPFGLALDEADNLCVTDMGTGRIWFFDQAKRRVRSWEKIGRFTLASPVAIAKRKGRFYVADSVLQKVVVFDERGRFLFAMDQTLTRPTGLAVSGEKLFVTDSATHHVAIFTLNGEFVSQFGQRGAAAGELNYPTHLAIDAEGRLLVTDSLNSRIEVFDPAGRFLSLIGSAGDTSGHFSRPKGVAADGFGHVYVVDALFDNFQVFDARGSFLLAVGTAGTAPGQFWMPAGIAISRNQQIFVADSYNGRIQVFQYLGKS